MKAVEWLELLQTGNLEGFPEAFTFFLDSEDEDEMYTVASGLVQLGFLNEGRQLFEKLHERLPTESILCIHLAEILLDEGEEEEAMLLLEKVPFGDDCYLNALLLLADCYESFDMPDVSERKMEMAYNLAPNEPVVQFAYAEILFLHGKHQEAVSIYQKIVDDETDFNGVTVVERLAEALALAGEYEQALSYFSRVKRFDKHLNLLFLYGFTAYHLKRFDLAREKFLLLIKSDEEYAAAYYYLGQLASFHDDFEAMLAFAQKGMAFDNLDIGLKMIAIESNVQLGQVDKAVTLLEAIIEIDPSNESALQLLAALKK